MNNYLVQQIIKNTAWSDRDSVPVILHSTALMLYDLGEETKLSNNKLTNKSVLDNLGYGRVGDVNVCTVSFV